jgi:glutathione synthase
MHVLFVLDPLPTLNAYKDSSVAMMRALEARGHLVSVALQGDLFIQDGQVFASATPIALVPGADLHEKSWWTETGAATDTLLQNFGAVIMRKDPPFDMEYVYITHMFDYAQAQGARVFNSGSAIRNHPEKLAITEFAQFTTPTLVTRDMLRIKAFHAEHHDVIVNRIS